MSKETVQDKPTKLRWKIMVVWDDGSRDYVKRGISPNGPDALFSTKAKAKEYCDFLKVGLDGYRYCTPVPAMTGAAKQEDA